MTPETGSVQLVVYSSGFVFVGRWHYDAETDCIILTPAVCVRRTNGTSGHFEMVTGPHAADLDKCHGAVTLPYAGLLFTVPCVEDAWAAKLLE